MPWVNPRTDLTSDEFDAFVEKCEEEGDVEALLSTSVNLHAGDLFDHTAGEIDEMEAEDAANGILFGSQHWREC